MESELPQKFQEKGSWVERNRARLERFNIVVSILGILALIAAIWALKLSLKAEELLSEIDQSVSTRYIASFPEDMGELVNLLRTADHKIVILCDGAGYGDLSRHTVFEDYVSVIKDRYRAGVKISVTIYDEKSWHQFIPPLFNGKLSEIKSAEIYAPYWKELDYRYSTDSTKQGLKKSKREEINTMEAFKAQLWEDEDHYRHEIPGVDGYVKPAFELPLCCWIVDDKKAIFTLIAHRTSEVAPVNDGTASLPGLTVSPLPAYGQENIRDQSFITSHHELVLALGQIVSLYRIPITSGAH